MRNWRKIKWEALRECVKYAEVIHVIHDVQTIYHQKPLTTALFVMKEYTMEKNILRTIVVSMLIGNAWIMEEI